MKPIILAWITLILPAHAWATVPEFWNLPKTQNPFQTQTPSVPLGTPNAPDAPNTYDESINLQPGLNLYQSTGELSDLFGTHGSQLCGPTSLAHRFSYFRSWRKPTVPLAKAPDVDGDEISDTYSDRIRYFFKLCHTDKEEGTHYHELLTCIQDYIQVSGFKPWAFIVGPHATENPAGTPGGQQRPLTVNDIRTYLSLDAALLMGIGWYNHDPITGHYTRTSGHFFNVYGYAYKSAWFQDQIVLKVVNPVMDYSGRTPDQMFDDVQMIYKGAQSPDGASYALDGPGFLPEYHGYVEDIFVALPLPKN